MQRIHSQAGRQPGWTPFAQAEWQPGWTPWTTYAQAVLAAWMDTLVDSLLRLPHYGYGFFGFLPLFSGFGCSVSDGLLSPFAGSFLVLSLYSQLLLPLLSAYSWFTFCALTLFILVATFTFLLMLIIHSSQHCPTAKARKDAAEHS